MSAEKMSRPRKKRRAGPWVLAVILVAAVLLISFLSGRRPGQELNVREVAVERGSLTVTVVGTGHLGYDKSWEIEVLSGILVDQVFPEAGDRVAKGDPLASFDPLSLDLAIDRILAELEKLERNLDQTGQAEETKVVRARTSGRVKAIFIGKGDKVAPVYKEEGAVMILSLDGRLAVEIESDLDLALEDKVQVILPDGSVKEGRVAEKKGKAYSFTLTDNGPKLDQTVSVQTEEGIEVGSGQLLINQPLPIVATEGEIKALHVSLNEKIVAGKALFTLEALPAGADYRQLLLDRAELKGQLDELMELKETGLLRAPSELHILQVSLKEGEETGSAEGVGLGQEGRDTLPAFTVAPIDPYVLTVQLDELDILSVKEGQEAGIAFDAISNERFSGVIDRVESQAVETAGSAKYPVRILVGADQAMRVGMSVTATITVEEKEAVLLLPVAALQESGSRVFVYTELDGKTGALAGETEVVTGLSDGDRVEIVKGLDEGGRVYYPMTEADSLFPFSPPGHRTGQNSREQEGGANDQG